MLTSKLSHVWLGPAAAGDGTWTQGAAGNAPWLVERVLGKEQVFANDSVAGTLPTPPAACSAVAGRRVAIVGNGPLDAAQREAANNAEVTLRFSALNSW